MSILFRPWLPIEARDILRASRYFDLGWWVRRQGRQSWGPGLLYQKLLHACLLLGGAHQALKPPFHANKASLKARTTPLISCLSLPSRSPKLARRYKEV